MTPNHIEILLHYHVSPVEHPRASAPAVIQATREMVIDGLLVQSVGFNIFHTTERGAAHVKQICELKLPRPVWIGENGEVIE